LATGYRYLPCSSKKTQQLLDRALTDWSVLWRLRLSETWEWRVIVSSTAAGQKIILPCVWIRLFFLNSSPNSSSTIVTPSHYFPAHSAPQLSHLSCRGTRISVCVLRYHPPCHNSFHPAVVSYVRGRQDCTVALGWKQVTDNLDVSLSLKVIFSSRRSNS